MTKPANVPMMPRARGYAHELSPVIVYVSDENNASAKENNVIICFVLFCFVLFLFVARAIELVFVLSFSPSQLTLILSMLTRIGFVLQDSRQTNFLNKFVRTLEAYLQSTNL